LSEAVRKKAQGIATQYVTPHLLSFRGGYLKLEEAMIKEKKKPRLMTTSRDDTGVIQPPSPPTRHQKWKMSRMKRSGAYSYFHLVVHLFYDINYMKNLDNFRVFQDSLVEQRSQDNFFPQCHRDILHEELET